jgi:hypothetical protein
MSFDNLTSLLKFVFAPLAVAVGRCHGLSQQSLFFMSSVKIIEALLSTEEQGFKNESN